MRSLLVIFCCLLCGTVHARQQLWEGLKEPQPVGELPVGRAAFVTPERKAFDRNRSVSTVAGDGTIQGGWVLAPVSADNDRFNAQVPGTVLTTLVEQGLYPDPFHGLNNLHIPDTLARNTWLYSTGFHTPEQTGRHTWLLFEGINYGANIHLNGEFAGAMRGAFKRGLFDVTDMLKRDGSPNELSVRIEPPVHPGMAHEQSIRAGQGLNGGVLGLDGPTFISSVGWDWIPGIRDRNIGIWQPVRLVQTGDVVIGDPLVEADLPLPDTTSVVLSVAIPLRNHAARSVDGMVEIEVAGRTIRLKYALCADEQRTLSATIHLKNPALWWPNGYGAQALYEAKITALQRGVRSDERKVRFGIRELSYELMVELSDGSHRRVLYTPSDAVAAGEVFDYVDRGRYNETVQLPKLKGGGDEFMRRHGLRELPADDPVGPYLVIRVNGRRIFCRGGNWGMDDGMKRVSRERLEPAFRLHKELNFNMIRNWTGESTEEDFYALCDQYGMLVWNDFWITTDDTVAPEDAELFLENAADVVSRFRNHPSIAIWSPRNEGFAPGNLERELPAVVAALDPTRHYHGQSRYLNMDTSGPWSYFEDPAKYYTECAKGFITEIGTYAVPTVETLRKFIPEEDLWPIGDVWAYHDLHHTTQNFAGFMRAVSEYGQPVSLEDFERKAQIVCYEAWRAIVEAWNSRMWNTATGQLLWMSHPAWPSMIWQTYTYDFQTPGSYFGVKKASERLHVQKNLDDGRVVVIDNDRIGAVEPKVHIDTIAVGSGLRLLRLELLRNGRRVSVNDYWEGDRSALNDIPTAKLDITREGGRITVKNISDVIAVSVKLDAADIRTGRTILPAYFSDGYFNLLPAEERIIEVEVPGYEHYDITTTGYNL